jgi:hypothetical protein
VNALLTQSLTIAGCQGIDDRDGWPSSDRRVYYISILPTGQLHLQGTQLQIYQCRSLLARSERISSDPNCILLVNVTKIGRVSKSWLNRSII